MNSKKVLVVVDAHAYFYNGCFYLNQFNYILLNRYAVFFDSVRFVARTKVVESAEELGQNNIIVDGKNVEMYPIPFFQGPIEYLKKYFMVKMELNNAVKGCQIVILRVPATISFASFKFIKKLGLPCAVEVVASPIEISKNSQSIIAKFFMWLMHFQQIKVCKYADGVSYVTEHVLQEMYPANKEEYFESHYSSVYLPDSFYGESKQYPKDTIFTLCHVAHPIKTFNKGHLTVLQVVKLLHDKGVCVKCKFAGDGELVPFFKKKALEFFIADKIEFVGLLTQQELKKFLSSSHLMLFPTVSEGLPRVIIEAMATGLPCLSSPVGGLSELLADEFLYEYEDVEGFTKKIIELMECEHKYEIQSNMSFIKAKDYSEEVLKSRREKFFNELLRIAERE